MVQQATTKALKDVKEREKKRGRKHSKETAKWAKRVQTLESKVDSLLTESFSITARVIVDAYIISLDPTCHSSDPRLKLKKCKDG